MDNFIEKLHMHITNLSDSEDVVAFNQALTMLESLGEHSKNMLQVGMLQDELIKLGFDKQYYSLFAYYPQPKTCIDRQYIIEVDFCTPVIIAVRDNNCNEWHYNENQHNLCNEVIDKVKQLIRDYNNE